MSKEIHLQREAPMSATLALDRRALRAAFAHAAGTYDAAAVLSREVADRMLARLDLIKQLPEVVLDAGCGTGYATRVLARRYRGAKVIGLDAARPMVRYARRKSGWFGSKIYVCGDIETLPLTSGSVDMVLSNLALPWCDPPTAFSEFVRVLRPGGFVMFSSLGPDTLCELREAWRTVDDAPHVHTFLDMHDIGDALMRAGFSDPVMDVERLTLTYATVHDVLNELKVLGAHNTMLGRARGLVGKKTFARFTSAYEALMQDGRIPTTIEVVYGHAWAPISRVQTETVTTVPLHSIVRRSR